MSSQSHLPHWSKSYVSHCRVLPPGEFNGMLSQSHVSHCRVLPLGEFTVMIAEPPATLQGAVTWQNQCHDCATLQGVRIPSAILKIVFAIFIFFCFLKCSLGFDEWRLSYRLWYTWKKLCRKTLAQDVFNRRWGLDGVKTLIKISVWDLQVCWSLQWGGHCVVDHNPNTSQRCHCCHFLR